ncbi:MAG: DUF3795 domain-containing protein [Candidatus Aenigmarchaeota archaeon]|nr:DUF3795 domain-containing protein [Candidatus Aenigmarchaeota archaeon]
MSDMGFCGIDCGKCELGNKVVSKNAETLKSGVEKYGISQWFQFIPVADDEKFSFDELDKGLTWLAKYAACPGCHADGGSPDCAVRKCAKEKKFEDCSSCDAIDTCNKLDFLEPGHPGLRENLKKM